jgi:diacylglycerol O-acyltransferase
LIPASTHALDEDDYLGNHLVGIRVRLPCSEPDPHRRLRQIAESSAREKRLRLPMLQAGRDHFPAVIVRPIVSFTLSRWFSDVHTSNRGWLGQGTLTVADSPVRRADPVGVQFRHQPFAFSIGTYQDRVVFQVGIDSSLPEPDRFAELWLDQLTALG